MENIIWFLQINESELNLKLSQSLSLNNLTASFYVLLSVIKRRPVYLLAFLVSVMLFHFSLFDLLLESDLYFITFIIYSYVFVVTDKVKNKIGCSIIILLTALLAIDSSLFGRYGYYGATETFLYINVQYFSLLAHLIFISTFIDVAAIKNGLRNIASFIGRISLCSDSVRYYCYNKKIKIKEDNEL